MPQDLIERLIRAPLVADGAMGTMLYDKGVYINKCYDEVNLSAPELVRDVHRSYVQAGSELIQTNTFGANAVKLAAHGLEARTEEINRVAARIAREEAGSSLYVAGSIGPLGIRIEPWGPTSVEEASGVLPSAGGGAPGRRRGRVHPRDVRRPLRGPRGDAGRARGRTRRSASSSR